MGAGHDWIDKLIHEFGAIAAIAIEKYDDLAFRLQRTYSSEAGASVTMSRFAHDFCASSARAFSRSIRAAVINDDEFTRNVGLETFADDASDRFFLVQCRNDYGNAGHRKTMCAAVK